MDLQIDISEESSIPAACKTLLEFASDVKVFAFTGNMGVGKTTFIKHLCRSLGADDNLSSPTYAIVNEYSSPQGKIYHFDLYRIKVVDELFDLGFEEYLFSGNYCFIEWPQLGQELFPMPYLDIILSLEGTRRLLSAVKC